MQQANLLTRAFVASRARSAPAARSFDVSHQNRAQAVMLLRGLTVGSLADNARVPRDSLQAWLGGNQRALSSRSLETVETTLGVSPTGLSAERLHTWRVDLRSAARRRRAMYAFNELSGDLMDARTAILVGEPQGFVARLAARESTYAISARGASILLRVTDFGPSGPTLFERLPGPHLRWHGGELARARILVPRELRAPFAAMSLTAAEVNDLVLNAQGTRWSNIIAIFRERGILPAEVLRLVEASGLNATEAPGVAQLRA
jgi:hypothetical protein